MKVALSGAHGTGKTTLIRAWPSAFRHVGLVKVCREAPRLLVERAGDPEFFRRGNNSPQRQAIIFLEHLIEESRQDLSADLIIVDRTLVDHLSYTANLFPNFVQTIEYRIYEDLARETLSRYKVIFRLPIEFEVQDDGVREGDQAFQKAIDSTISGYYSRFGVVTHELRGSVEQRLRTARAVLDPLISNSSSQETG